MISMGLLTTINKVEENQIQHGEDIGVEFREGLVKSYMEDEDVKDMWPSC